MKTSQVIDLMRNFLMKLIVLEGLHKILILLVELWPNRSI